MSLLHTLHLHFDWNIVCWHTAHIYTDAFDSLHKSVNNFLSEEQRGQMCPILSSVCLLVLVQMLLLFQQSVHLSWLYPSKKKKKTFFSLYLYSPAYFTTGTKASDVKRDAHQTVAPYDEPLVQHTETFDGWLFGSALNSILTLFKSKAKTATKRLRKYTDEEKKKKKTPQTPFPACVHNHNMANTAFRPSG